MIHTEHHCHILPGIDDGADSVETSLAMAELMKEQGVGRIVATPHFYAHREKSVERFLKKREEAFRALKKSSPAVGDIILGAEVAIENGLSKLPEIEKLAFQGTDVILLELPYRAYSHWMSDEIYDISTKFGLKVVIAHIHRYLDYYSKSDYEEILSAKAVFQVNNEAFGSFRERRFVKKLIKSGLPVIFGSDSHNMGSRKPNWDLLAKKADGKLIEESDSFIDKHIKKK
ncbi:MAG TPA: capsular polysaccharide biosynthesis protein [Ruminococcus sp.]|mgnify:CR=1 FL=1|nr:capsular polysaccharide biosynthesis protein [Ruminococcus sp.]